MAASIRLNGNPTPIAVTTGTPVVLSNFDNTGVAGWDWILVDRPAGSASVITGPASATAGVTPDVEGSYLIKLRTWKDAGKTILDGVATAIVYIRFVASPTWRIPAAGETLEVDPTRGWATEVNDILIDLQALGAGGVTDLQEAYNGGPAIVIGGGGPVNLSRATNGTALTIENDTALGSVQLLDIQAKTAGRTGPLARFLHHSALVAPVITIADNAADLLKIWADGLRGSTLISIKPDDAVAKPGYDVQVIAGKGDTDEVGGGLVLDAGPINGSGAGGQLQIGRTNADAIYSGLTGSGSVWTHEGEFWADDVQATALTNSTLTNFGRINTAGVISPAQITSDQTDYSPTGYLAANVLRLSSDASRVIRSLWVGPSAQTLLIENVGSFDIILAHEHVSGTASARFATPDGVDFTLAKGAGVHVWYDVSTSRWRIVSALTGGSSVSLQEAYNGGPSVTIGGGGAVRLTRATDGTNLEIENDTALGSVQLLDIQSKTAGRTGPLARLLHYSAAVAPALTIADNVADLLKLWGNGIRGRVALLFQPDVPAAAGTSGYNTSVNGGHASAGGGGGQKGGNVLITAGNSVATGGSAGEVTINGGAANGGAADGAVNLGTGTTTSVRVGAAGGTAGVPLDIHQQSAAPVGVTDAVRMYAINEVASGNRPTAFLEDESSRGWRLMGGEASLVDDVTTPYSLLTTDIGLRVDASESSIDIELPSLANSYGMMPIPIYVQPGRAYAINFIRGDAADDINGVVADLAISPGDPVQGEQAGVGSKALTLLLSRTDQSWLIHGLPAVDGQPVVDVIPEGLYDGTIGRGRKWQRWCDANFKGKTDNNLFGAATGTSAAWTEQAASSGDESVGILGTGTDTNGKCRLYSWGNWFYGANADLLIQDLVGRLVDVPDGTNDYKVRVVGVGLPVGTENGYSLSIDRGVSTTNWLRTKWVAGVATHVDTGIAFANTRARFRSVFDRVANSVEFFINGASAGSVGTLPTMSAEYITVAEILKVAGTTSRAMHTERYFSDVVYKDARPG